MGMPRNAEAIRKIRARLDLETKPEILNPNPTTFRKGAFQLNLRRFHFILCLPASVCFYFQNVLLVIRIMFVDSEKIML